MATILLVDDDALVRDSIAAQLRRRGHEVHLAAPGIDRAGIPDLRDLDLIITGIHLPGMEGTELLRRLRAEAPHLPAIVMTGGPTRTLARTTAQVGGGSLDPASSQGTTRTIGKPFTPTALLALIRDCLGEEARGSTRRNNGPTEGHPADGG